MFAMLNASAPLTPGDMMESRERRAAYQQSLLRPGEAVVSFTMNIPGPRKLSPLRERGFDLGRQLIRQQLSDQGWAFAAAGSFVYNSGYEAFWQVRAAAPEVKRALLAVERDCPVGRLFDIDVLDEAGRPLSRTAVQAPPRTCLLCHRPAHECGRVGRHSLEELLSQVDGLLREHFCQLEADRAAALACRAMLAEVSVTPKPGLVDRRDSGAHRDMDFFTFLDSAAVLTPHFRRFFLLGRQQAALAPEDCFQRLRYPGRLAEADMYRATGGVNTHKGMIFSLALLSAAWGRRYGLELPIDAAGLLQTAAQMAGEELRRELGGEGSTAGQRLYAQSGGGGLRCEAAAGYPTVLRHGLPCLQAYLGQGCDLNRAGALTLINILAHCQDSNVFARCGLAAQQQLRQEMLALSQRPDPPSLEELSQLNQEFIAKNISPGGAADLLALTFYLHFLDEEQL